MKMPLSNYQNLYGILRLQITFSKPPNPMVEHDLASRINVIAGGLPFLTIIRYCHQQSNEEVAPEMIEIHNYLVKHVPYYEGETIR